MITLKFPVRRGIRTLAHRSGLRPERSALDHSAILTLKAWFGTSRTIIVGNDRQQL